MTYCPAVGCGIICPISNSLDQLTNDNTSQTYVNKNDQNVSDKPNSIKIFRRLKHWYCNRLDLSPKHSITQNSKDNNHQTESNGVVINNELSRVEDPNNKVCFKVF